MYESTTEITIVENNNSNNDDNNNIENNKNWRMEDEEGDKYNPNPEILGSFFYFYKMKTKRLSNHMSQYFIQRT